MVYVVLSIVPFIKMQFEVSVQEHTDKLILNHYSTAIMHHYVMRLQGCKCTGASVFLCTVDVLDQLGV